MPKMLANGASILYKNHTISPTLSIGPSASDAQLGYMYGDSPKTTTSHC